MSDLDAAIENTGKAVRIGADCAQFMQSETVAEFFDALEREAINFAIKQPLTANEERYRALVAVETARKLRAFMKAAADQREFNSKQLEELLKRRDAE